MNDRAHSLRLTRGDGAVDVVSSSGLMSSELRQGRSKYSAVADWRGCPRLGGLGTSLVGTGGESRELRVSADASEMVTVPRAELDAAG